MLAILFNAVTPALAAVRHAIDPRLPNEICTVGGLKTVSPSPAFNASDNQPTTPASHSHGKHCPLCLSRHDVPALLSTAPTLFLSPLPRHGKPAAAQTSLVLSAVITAPQPRGPPSFA